MKIYKTKSGIIIERDQDYRGVMDESWDDFINDDDLYQKIQGDVGEEIEGAKAGMLIANEVRAPIKSQEVWASGVTYYNSKLGRQEESKDAGGGSFYAHVYEAERPEIFFKSTPHRVVGPNDKVRIRQDSTWDAPEPELTLVDFFHWKNHRIYHRE
jgi:2-dehydro-3-deoxy-D-arabinonate dehydratase